jgi:Co/Zn/Cd efflux system component
VSTLVWIVSGGLAMSAIALVGTATLLLSETTQRRLVRPPQVGATHFLAFVAGAGLLAALKLVLGA